MLNWLSDNASLVQATVGAVTAIVWIVYLQLFLLSFLRQRRPEILINRGAGVGVESRCFIANLGFEPIYISQLLMSLRTADDTIEAAITDRKWMSEEQQRDPMQATNQGPLKSGDSFDAGSFGELVAQTLKANGLDEETLVESLELTVVAHHAASAAFIGATRRFDIFEREDGRRDLVPDGLTTRQIRTIIGSRRLRNRLRRQLSWHRS